MKTIDVESTGWNVLHFNEMNQVILRQDNFFIKRKDGLDPHIPGESVWQYVWNRR